MLQGKAEVVVEHHMREIARRHKTGGDTRLATDAECLCGLLGAATLAPLTSSSTDVATKLSTKVLGLKFDRPMREQYPGEHDEILSQCRHKLRQEWRK